jgi:hypothetical protein
MLTQERIDLIAFNFAQTGFKSKSGALRKTGYSDNYARALGLKLYDNVRVKQAIDDIKAELAQKQGLTKEIWINKVIDTERRAKNANDFCAEARQQDMQAKYLKVYNDEGSQDKPVQQLTINDIKVLIQSTQGPALPENLGIAGSQSGHLRPSEADTDEKE